MKRLALLVTSLVLGIATAQAQVAGLLFISDFQYHGFDAAILKSLGYDVGAILYWKEMASITTAQRNTSTAYEGIGCYPFYLMRNGKSEDFGLNCRTFFCAGYRKGVIQCQKADGLAYGGEAEIQRRKSNKALGVKFSGPKYFDEFAKADRTVHMEERLAVLTDVQCRPFYTIEFGDVATGEGYNCEEVGSYPYYSSAHICAVDWRKGAQMTCTPVVRDDELALRKKAIGLRETSGEETLEEEEEITPVEPSTQTGAQRFPDVPTDHDAAQAIAALAERGIIEGYPDGTFQPERTINRAELLKLLVAGLHSAEVQAEVNCFPDVTNQWFSPFVCAAKRLGWIAGYPDGTFQPNKTVNRAEAIKMISSSLTSDLNAATALPRDVSPYTWYALYVRVGVKMGMIPEDRIFGPSAAMTRGDTALWIYRAMQNSEQGEEEATTEEEQGAAGASAEESFEFDEGTGSGEEVE
ncbi:MAG: S-layer homology domain-containing protein [Candidatus Peregrinibacteria bacterium]|nr:S-layer homology domain-containing protein [Candidatus Peregrinibacteria bacterium]